jgi:hypothetical protein
MADRNAASSTPEEQELRDKVTRLVEGRHGGDWRRAFDSYTKGGSGVNRDQLMSLLDDAGIGNWATRGAWATGILKKMDTNVDGNISWTEFDSLIRSGGR